MQYGLRWNERHQRLGQGGWRLIAKRVLVAVAMDVLVLAGTIGFGEGSPAATRPSATIRSMVPVASGVPVQYEEARLQWEIAARVISSEMSTHLLIAANDLAQAVNDGNAPDPASYETAIRDLENFAELPDAMLTSAQDAEAQTWVSALDGFFNTPGLFRGTYQPVKVAFQANTSDLWTADDSFGGTNWSLGLMSGTSPSITAVNGGYEIAFEANTGDLWTVGTLGDTAWNLGMMNGTSPSIIALDGGVGFEVAVQTNTGDLWAVGAYWDTDYGGLGMRQATSPSIASR